MIYHNITLPASIILLDSYFTMPGIRLFDRDRVHPLHLPPLNPIPKYHLDDVYFYDFH